jgi:hypothetical protein
VAELRQVSDLGIHILTGEMLLVLLHKVAAGADPDWVYAETYVNATHIDTTDEEGEDE